MTYRNVSRALAAFAWLLAFAGPSFARQTPAPLPSKPPATARAGQPPTATPPGKRTAPQGFSVVLVLGDIQGAPTADDVPTAARKALADMRDFLPFKTYRLLDAAWLMCCGSEPQSRNVTRNASSSVSQLLRGPEDQEYQLHLTTSSAEGSRVFVRFSLYGQNAQAQAALELQDAADARVSTARNQRRLADLTDKHAVLQKQIQDTKQRVDVGVAPQGNLAMEELELRKIEREIAEVRVTAEAGGGRSAQRVSPRVQARSSIIDTSFTMDVGETVVVGTSRLKGGTKALIALLTAVPPRSGASNKE